MSTAFAAAAIRGDVATLAARAASALPESDEGTLGIIYATEAAAPVLPEIVRELGAHTGIESWVGGAALGLIAAEGEIYDDPAAVVMTAALPPESFRLAAAAGGHKSLLPRQQRRWIESASPALALMHGDPRFSELPQAMNGIAAASGAFLVGGLLSHRVPNPLLARAGEEGGFGGHGLSGVMFAADIAVATALTQGCVPIGPVRQIDEARDNLVMAIDGRPALSVLLEDIGPELAQNLRSLGGRVFVGLPVAGTDTGDYLVRNLMAIDPGHGCIAVGERVAAGERILFCRRDPESARRDMARMLGQLENRLAGPPKAGIYVSCIARGTALFGEEGIELGLIRENLGDFPLIGFFANGEISRDRLYGHTGVLTLFL